jgi:hypothetical protein
MVSPVTKEITHPISTASGKPQDGGMPRSQQYEIKFFDCNNWRMTAAEKPANDPHRVSHLSFDHSKSNIRAAPLRSEGLVPQCHESGAVNYLIGYITAGKHTAENAHSARFWGMARQRGIFAGRFG